MLCLLSNLYNNNMNKHQNSRFNRKYNTRKENKIIYIFSEGKETEYNYFKSKKQEIRKQNIKIEVKSECQGCNTLSLVDCALHYLVKQGIKIDDSANNDECWVVFDKDDFDKDFDNAINKAIARNIKVAYSNESFELWFLLHFDLHTSALPRAFINKKLDDLLQKRYHKKYEKNSENMYSLIKDQEQTAIQNANYLIKMHKGKKLYREKNPSTTVHLLVESLNKLK